MRSKRSDSEAGFSLVEVLMAFSLLGIVLAGLTPGFIQHMKQVTQTNIKTEAMSVAQKILDEARLTNPPSMPSSGASSPQSITIGAHTYQGVLKYCENSSLCSANTRHLTVEIHYSGNKVYEAETVYTKLR